METYQVTVSSIIFLVLLFILGHTLAVAPGDEDDDGCAVPNYPDNIKVLMDSWRYQTLLPSTWTATNSDSNNEDTWISAGGMCENSAVKVCHRGPGDEILDTQIINKSLPASDDYPVRIFVNITYSFMSSCPGPMGCVDNFELQVGTMKENGEMSYSIMPDHRIRDTNLSGTQHFYFDSSQGEDNFVLRLKGHPPMGVCLTISRVLVYRHECPDHEHLSTGLARRPATQSAIDKNVSVTAQCAENSHHSEWSIPDNLMCTPRGKWHNAGTQCICDLGYSNDDDPYKCEEISIKPTTLASPPNIAETFLAAPSSISTMKISISTTPTTTNKPSVTTTENSSDVGAVLGGVGAIIAVIIILIIVAILMIIILVRKNRNKQKESDKDLANPVYNAVTQNDKQQHSKSNAINGHGVAQEQDEETLRKFSNPLYMTTRDTNGKSNNFDEPAIYSVPNGNGDTIMTPTGYETPVITSPLTSAPPSPHVYDYAVVILPSTAATVPQCTAPEYAVVPSSTVPQYAVLEPPVHSYHCLEFPDSPSEHKPGISCIREETMNGGDDGGKSVNHEYSVIGHK